jgi:hypothetical protein
VEQHDRVRAPAGDLAGAQLLALLGDRLSRESLPTTRNVRPGVSAGSVTACAGAIASTRLRFVHAVIPSRNG